MFRTLLFSNSGDNHNQIADKYRSLQTTRPYVLYDPRVRNIGNISFAFLAATRTINNNFIKILWKFKKLTSFQMSRFWNDFSMKCLPTHLIFYSVKDTGNSFQYTKNHALRQKFEQIISKTWLRGDLQWHRLKLPDTFGRGKKGVSGIFFYKHRTQLYM